MALRIISALLVLSLAGCSPVRPSSDWVVLSLDVLDSATGRPVSAATCGPIPPCSAMRVPAGFVVYVSVQAPGYEARVQPYRVDSDTKTAIGLRVVN